MSLFLDVKEALDKVTLQNYLNKLGGHALYIPELWEVLYDQARIVNFILRAKDEIYGMAMGIECRGKKLLFLKGKKTLTIPFAPLLKNDDSGLMKVFLKEVIEYTTNEKYDTLEIDWRYGHGDEVNTVRKFTDDIREEVEFFIDLTEPEEKLLGSYFPGKSKYKRAQKDGLYTELGETWEDLVELRSMQITASARAAAKDNLYNLPDEEYYEKVYDACMKPGYSKIIFAKKGNKRISGLMFLVSSNRSVVQRGGSTDEAFPLGASRYLHYALIKHLKELGCRDVYFGGVPAEAVQLEHGEHGLYLFKKGFPAKEIPAFKAKITL